MPPSLTSLPPYTDAQLFISNEPCWITAAVWPEPGLDRRPALLLGRADGRLVLLPARRTSQQEGAEEVEFGRNELEHCGSSNGESGKKS